MTIAYANPVGPAATDPTLGDFACQLEAAIKPVQQEVNARVPAKYGNYGNYDLEVKSIPLYETYQVAMEKFKEQIEHSGFMRNAPKEIKKGKVSYVGHRHVLTNVRDNRNNRAQLEKLSKTGRDAIQKRGALTDGLSAKEKKEEALVAAQELYAYAHQRVRDESLALSSRLVAGTRREVKKAGQSDPVQLVDGWEFDFKTEKDVQKFFKQEFKLSSKSVSKQDEIRWMIEQGKEQLSKQPPRTLDFPREFSNRTEVIEFFESLDPPVSVSRPSPAQKRDILISNYLDRVPFGRRLLEHAKRFKQTAWDFSSNPFIHDWPTAFKLADGTLCRKTDRVEGTGFEVVAATEKGDGATLQITRPDVRPADGREFVVKLAYTDENQQRKVIEQSHPDFLKMVEAHFHPHVLGALFDKKKAGQALSVLTYEESFGRIKAGIELESKVEGQLYKGLEEEVRQCLEDHGNPDVFQGTGNAYNKALYGVNWGSEMRGRVMEQVFKSAGAGHLFAHGSCGFQQEAVYMFGGHIVAVQDGGKTYRHSDHGADILDTFKESYAKTRPDTDTAGIYETKQAVSTVVDGVRVETKQWAMREAVPLSLPMANSDHSLEIRDSNGKPIVASQGLQLHDATAYLSNDPLADWRRSKEKSIDPLRHQTVVLQESTAEGEVLADDLGRPILDDNGKPVTQLEKITLKAMLNGEEAQSGVVQERERVLRNRLIDVRMDELKVRIEGARKNRQPELAELLSAVRDYLNESKRYADGERPRYPDVLFDRAFLRLAIRQAEPSELSDVDADRKSQTSGLLRMLRSMTRQKTYTSAAQDRVRSEISYQVAHVSRWERIPMTEELPGQEHLPEAERRRTPCVADDGSLLYTYQLMDKTHPSADDLRDWSYQRIRCVHSQNGLNVDYAKALTNPALEYVSFAVPSQGVETDGPSKVVHRPGVVKGSKIMGIYQEGTPGAQTNLEGVELFDGRGRLAQYHFDSMEGEAPTEGDKNDPMVHAIQGDVAPEFHGPRNGIKEAATSGATIRGNVDVRQELKDKLASIKLKLDSVEAEETERARLALQHDLVTTHASTEVVVLRDIEDAVLEASKSRVLTVEDSEEIERRVRARRALEVQHPDLIAEDHRAQKIALFRHGRALKAMQPRQPEEAEPAPTKTSLSRRKTVSVEADIVEETVRSKQLAMDRARAAAAAPEVAGPPAPSIEETRDLVKKKIDEIDAAISILDPLEKDRNKTLEVDTVIQRYFKAFPDSLRKVSMTPQVRAFAGTGDVFAAGMTAAQLGGAGHAAGSFLGMAAGNLIGSALLSLAGIEGMKDAQIDRNRLKKLMKPLRAYQAILKREQVALVALRAEGGGQTQPALEGTVRPSLKGVNARLAAAERQLADSTQTLATSSLLAGAGATGVTAAALGMAGLGMASGIAASVYGIAVAVFGGATLYQARKRLKELDGLPAAIDKIIDNKDNSLRVGIQTLLGHQEDALNNEIYTRMALTGSGAVTSAAAAAGTTAAALSPATLGLSLPITGAAGIVAGVVMGGSTALAFRQNKKAHRGLLAVGGVEPTTNLSTTFLQDVPQLNHLVNTTNGKMGAIFQAHMEIIDEHFKYKHREHTAIAKFLPNYDRQKIAEIMEAEPQSVADTSQQFMLRTTQFDLHYLEQHKLPELDKEIKALMEQFEQTPAVRENFGLRGDLVTHLKLKDALFVTESARLGKLKNLENRLSEYNEHLGKAFLNRPDLAKGWNELRADFILAHDLAREALGVGPKDYGRLRNAASRTGDPVRDALLNGIDNKFAKVLTRSYPEKIAYEGRGALEIARRMFMQAVERGEHLDAEQREEDSRSISTNDSDAASLSDNSMDALLQSPEGERLRRHLSEAEIGRRGAGGGVRASEYARRLASGAPAAADNPVPARSGSSELLRSSSSRSSLSEDGADSQGPMTGREPEPARRSPRWARVRQGGGVNVGETETPVDQAEIVPPRQDGISDARRAASLRRNLISESSDGQVLRQAPVLGVTWTR